MRDDENFEEEDLFEILSGVMAHSDIFLLNIASDILVSLKSVIDAFEDRNPYKAVNMFKATVLAGIVNVLFECKTTPSEIINLVIALICEATGKDCSEFFNTEGGQ